MLCLPGYVPRMRSVCCATPACVLCPYAVRCAPPLLSNLLLVLRSMTRRVQAALTFTPLLACWLIWVCWRAGVFPLLSPCPC